jgi:beta-1,4-mannosyl-glycoprotein beta-1,4-N-acetylglucosaminyltransferase
MIYDVFTFFNELELLELRLNELSSVVDFFVICEATKTHRGEAKPLFFEENRERFKPWLDRIYHYVVHDMPGGSRNDIEATWCREFHQRDCIKRILPRVADDDVVVFGDADEIIRPSSLESYSTSMGIRELEMRFYHFFLNYKSNGGWSLATIFPGHVYNTTALSSLRHVDHRYPKRYKSHGCLADAGWHFSYTGGIERVKYKLRSYTHWNSIHTLPALAGIQNGRPVDLLKIGKQSDHGEHEFDWVEIDRSFPGWVRKNRKYYERIGFVSLKSARSEQAISAPQAV